MLTHAQREQLGSLALYALLAAYNLTVGWRFATLSLAALCLLAIAHTIVARIRALQAVETIPASRVWALPGEQAQKDNPQGFGSRHG